MVFENIYELLEAVRTYHLRSKESLIQVCSPTGTTFGYFTADSAFPSISWTIDLSVAKATALARGTRESLHVRELLSSFMGRRQLLIELREGVLDYGVAATPRPPVGVIEIAPPLPAGDPFSIPGELKQCLIPGL
jgi:hypothetical protein